ncbi:hypothetical protein ASPZODRAFT_1187186 [Penicilliopsis zonata CBS 506.65]|uniref:Uncharacterized protein n=1 Tax=Penicilliopsis zonata CBS 506.65 TaxID=1073090 RepID=A0A1L9S7X2_9EURO|nr:hypothetical protein ASPZODRAFT_1187186 [Penicilliopsis zonata CBS 506.65]OJJ43262.1 hypothetical protein ASPZODRAFT_1187186 [Penicilliopsis zonata CBS 506.65]
MVSEEPTGGRSSSGTSAERQQSDGGFRGAGSVIEARNEPPDLEADLRYHRDFLDRLLRFVSTEDQNSVAYVISVIRAGASHEGILAAMDRMLAGQSNGAATEEQNGELEQP